MDLDLRALSDSLEFVQQLSKVGCSFHGHCWRILPCGQGSNLESSVLCCNLREELFLLFCILQKCWIHSKHLKNAGIMSRRHTVWLGILLHSLTMLPSVPHGSMIVSLQVSAEGPTNSPTGRRPVSRQFGVCVSSVHMKEALERLSSKLASSGPLFRRQNLSWSTVSWPRDRRPRPLLSVRRRHCGLKGYQRGQECHLENSFFLLPLFFLLGACERMKRMKEKRQKGTFEKSLKVLSSKSCNFWVRVGSSFTVMGHEVLCALWASAVCPAAQGLCQCSSDWPCPQRHSGKATARWPIFID